MGFERCHPAVNLLYFSSVIAGTLGFFHPVYLLISYVCAACYAVWRGGGRALAFVLGLLPCIALFAMYYSSYTHFGVTVLRHNFVGNNMTLEALVYGAALGLSAAGVMVWFSCVYAVFSSDKVVYLFGRVSPKLSLFLAILLRLVPRIKGEARRINTARNGVGRGAGQGNVLRRAGNALAVFSMLITWTAESLVTASESMACRGGRLRGRTAFSLYRFDHRDRVYVIATFTCLTVTAMAAALGQGEMQYGPRLVFPPLTAMSYVFFAGYAALCLMPLGLELWTAYRFAKARRAL